ncbi:unnamed protein product, partial [Timema podura]|nr:unnamed protein product [Timema podura]
RKLVRVLLGSTGLNSRSDDSEEFQVEDSFEVHPGYSTIRSYNDIALIRLPRKVKLSELLFPACLYTREDLPRGPFNIAGWGATDKDGIKMSTELRKATIQPLSLDRCNQTYPIGPKLRMGLNEDMLCFYDPKGETDTCMNGERRRPFVIERRHMELNS